MGLSVYQVTAPTTPSTIKLCDVNPGETVVLSTVSATADVFIGLTSTVTSGTGAPLDVNAPLTIVYPTTATKATLYCTSGTGTHIVGVVAITGT